MNCSLGGTGPLLQRSGKLQKKPSSYWLGLWSGGKLTDGQSQSCCDPINSGPKWDLLSTPRLQQLHQHLRLTGAPLRAPKPSSVWYSKNCLWQWGWGWFPPPPPPHLYIPQSETLACQEMQRDLVWVFHWTWGEFLIGSFTPIEIDVRIILPVCLWIDYGMNVTISNLWLSHCYNCSKALLNHFVNVKEFNF